VLGKGLDGVTVSYGFAHLGKISFWYASEILLAYYLSEVCGLPPAQMGVILASSLLLSAAADLAVARILQHRLACVQQVLRMQLRGAVVASLALLALFLGTYVPAELRLAYGLAFAAAFRLGYVILDLPQNVLMSIATDSEASRSRLASLRMAMSSIGALLVSAALVPLVSRQIALPVALRFVMLAVALSMLALAGAFSLRKAVTARLVAAPSPPPRTTGKSVAASLVDAPLPACAAGKSLMARLVDTPPLPRGAAARPRHAGRWLPAPLYANIMLAFVIALAWSCFTKVAPFYSAYYLPAARHWTIYVLPAAAIGAAFSQPLWACYALRMPERRLLATGAGMMAVAVLLFSKLAGLPVAALAAACFAGAGSSGIGMALWASFSGMVATQQAVSAAMAFGMLTAALKVALACGALGIGAVLSQIDYRQGDAAVLVDLMTVPTLAGALCVLVASVATGAGRRLARRSE
jgi:Na+/melibiose symporter-like transporter